jgi:hypothetical protein
VADAILGLSIIGGVCLYFLPTMIAILRRTERRATVFALNLLFGWTVAGWLAIVIWVASSRLSSKRNTAASAPIDHDTWSFDFHKSSEHAVEQSDHWVLGLEPLMKPRQKIS